MRIAVILNGISLQKKVFYKTFLPALQAKHEVDVYETHSKHDGIHIASALAEKKNHRVIFAAGGDGTLHQVVNGVLSNLETASSNIIGLIPLGSGNDFAKTVNVRQDVHQTLQLLDKLEPQLVNVGLIHYTDFSNKTQLRYFVNVADLGMGPEVVQKVLSSGRAFGSAFAYYVSILRTFLSYKPMKVTATTSEWTWEGKARSLAVANGKYYGHGLCIAPDAKINDDIFSAFICGDVSVIDFIIQSETLKKGGHIAMDEVHYKTTRSISFTSEKECLIEGDGEVLGKLPANVACCDFKIKMLI